MISTLMLEGFFLYNFKDVCDEIKCLAKARKQNLKGGINGRNPHN